MGPNVLLITTDQHRWDWLGCHGTPGVETPHLDALAARGTRITGHVTNSSVCVPARIGLATGVTPLRQGAQSNDDVLSPAMPTYYQALRDAGYHVGCVGKLDLNKRDVNNGPRGDRPIAYQWGFTHPVETLGKTISGLNVPGSSGPYRSFLAERGLLDEYIEDYVARAEEMFAAYNKKRGNKKSTSDHWYRNSVLPADAWMDSWIGRRSCEWLEEVPTTSPWHLYISFVGPHDPFDPPEEYSERFRDADVPEPVLDAGTARAARFDQSTYDLPPEELMRARRQYTAGLAAIDHQVGEVLATLDRLGMADDTLVLFSADHGEMLGDHRLFQKHYAYEPAMRIPMLAAGPGIGVGVSDALTELVDVTATILDYADTEIPDIDGRSMRPIFADADARIRDVVTCNENPYRSIRTERWKYIHNIHAAGDPHELYHLAVDPDETHNLIDEEPVTASELRDELAGIVGADQLEAAR